MATTLTGKLATGMAASADGAHVRSMLKDNAAAARAVRAQQAIEETAARIEAVCEVRVVGGLMLWTVRGQRAASAVVTAQFDGMGGMTVRATVRRGCSAPAAAFERATVRRVERNARATAAARAALEGQVM